MRDIFQLIKYKIAPQFSDLKRLFFFAGIYSIIIFGISFYKSNDELVILRIVEASIPISMFFLIWGVEAVIMMGQFVDRPEPIFKFKHLMKPGRYIMRQIGPLIIARELKISPVDDFCISLLIIDFIFLPLVIISTIVSGTFSTIFFNIIFASHLAILKEINRLEKDYVENMKKAKVIFFKNKGDMNVLKEHEEYQRYQVSLEYEEKWCKELNEIKESMC
ncbi:MAG: hypothetical protein KHZ15_09970 [Coprobacillus cateniformis]|uniref:hypothetical protein n=1 Tax=Longibaculum muris TaxID=1796628 RepID=UPI003AB38A45|nr:hypothetical protein [Coprobacillus cateniformis]